MKITGTKIGFRFSMVTMVLMLMLSSLVGQTIEKSTDDFTDASMMVRIAALEIYPEHLQDYLAILKEEAEASVRLEKGVICIYPMYIEENKNQIRLLEIYANRKAYEEHLKSPHFKHYKTATLKMVKKLELIDMKPIDNETMPDIFKKMGQSSD